ncbi:hypothetical protein [Mucilaginibacter sp. L3T2-6]|uniref:hypothetical protein n=1 Tax=Mucilaginibacter sp. L3T2-6 TaxID=3062491 RepID=UPI002675A270|nr:hypothetical protein [Mucilaginibacter sp. L3T2-6]MDO3643210.1 hypothetical protein [Mucilaginibacter sp. L3T2-6]MDV6215534.1 hypothetical protein [Mucilaginibacter sp. L3T2-6]
MLRKNKAHGRAPDLTEQRVITPEGKGEVADATGVRIAVKQDSGFTETFPSDDLQDDNNTG